jgi:hypothetical protein
LHQRVKPYEGAWFLCETYLFVDLMSLETSLMSASIFEECPVWSK